MRIRRSTKSLVLFCMVALLSALFVSDAPPAAAASAPWWNGSYADRYTLDVAAADALPSGYSLQLTFNHLSMTTVGASLTSGNDVRVVYWNGSTSTELDRVLDYGSSWNSQTTSIWFRTQAAISANSFGAGYFLYVGNPSATAPPTDANNVFDVWDDFSGTFNTGKWGKTNQTGVTVSQTGGQIKVSGTSAANTTAFAYSGITSVATYTGGWEAESSFSIVSQTANVQKYWKGHNGPDDATLTAYSNNTTTKSVSWLNGASWVNLANSTLTGQTFASHRVIASLTPNGTASWAEDGTLITTRTGLTPANSYLRFSYSPNQQSETFDVRYDDIIIRKVVDNRPTVMLSRGLDMNMTIDATLTLGIAGHPSGSCNGAAPTAGTSSSSTTIDLGLIPASGTAIAGQELTVTTNAPSGYSLYLRTSGGMNNGAGRTWTSAPGTNLAPQVFPGSGTEAIGYTTDHALSAVGAGATRFQSNKWAALPATNEEVAYVASGYVSDTTCVEFQQRRGANTPAGRYQTRAIYTVVPKF